MPPITQEQADRAVKLLLFLVHTLEDLQRCLREAQKLAQEITRRQDQ
jgi:hypothetical protein